MANNVMYLKNKRTGTQVKLAKYYPSTGWYPFHIPKENIDLIKRLSKAFDDNELEPSISGDNDWVIEYEHEVPQTVDITELEERN